MGKVIIPTVKAREDIIYTFSTLNGAIVEVKEFEK